MSLTCLNQVALQFVGGGSDKVYVVQVQKEETAAGTTYRAVGYYGRRGSSFARAEKYNGTSLASAQAAADKLEREKRTKSSYTDMPVAAGSAISGMPSGAPVFGGASTTAAPTATPMAKAIVGILPMLAKDADEARAEALLLDPNWGAQRKYDGERVTVSLRRSAIQAANRNGIARPLTEAAEASLKLLLAQTDFSDDRETVFDGELMGDQYIIYDVVTLRDNDMRHLSCEERYSALEELLADHLGLLAPMAWSPAEKSAMLARARAEGWEGLMFRNLLAAYLSGRSADLLRFKLWATCTCRVLTTNGSTRSVQVALRNEAGDEEFCGNVTVPVNQDIPEVDGLVEVRYLYAHDGGSLYQPTLIAVRNDVDEADLRSSLRAAPPEKRGEALEPMLEAA